MVEEVIKLPSTALKKTIKNDKYNIDGHKLTHHVHRVADWLDGKSDFFYRSQVMGPPPPQVIHLVFGNCTNKRLMEYLELHWHSIEVALQVPVRLIVVGKDSMKIWI